MQPDIKKRNWITKPKLNKRILHGLRIGWNLASLRKNPKNKIVCCNCGSIFYRRGNRKFRLRFVSCSKQCKNIFQGKIKYQPRLKLGKEIACKVCLRKRYFPPSAIRTYCSQECYFNDENSNRKKGQSHYRWTGGVKYLRYKDLKLRKWQRLVRKRDGRVCRRCRSKVGIMIADHILPWSCYPEFRYAIENGQILCKECHILKTKEENKNRDKKGKLLMHYKEILKLRYPSIWGQEMSKRSEVHVN